MFARFSSLGIRMFLQVDDFFSAIFFWKKIFSSSEYRDVNLHTCISSRENAHDFVFFCSMLNAERGNISLFMWRADFYLILSAFVEMLCLLKEHRIIAD